MSITAPSGSIVYYTLDGSDPTDRSTIYSSPIQFDVDSVVGLQAVQDITASVRLPLDGGGAISGVVVFVGSLVVFCKA